MHLTTKTSSFALFVLTACIAACILLSGVAYAETPARFLAVESPSVTSSASQSQTAAVFTTGSAAADAAAPSTSAPASDIFSGNWERLWGANAYDTMADVIRKGWSSSSTVVIATRRHYHDALTASALAGSFNAPILLTERTHLPTQTSSEIKRLKAKRAYVMGGTIAITKNVETQLSQLGVTHIQRVWGRDARGTAVAVANELGGSHSKTAIIATSTSFQDALSIAPYAYKTKSPIFLTSSNGTSLDAQTRAALQQGGYQEAVIVGGPIAVKQSVHNQINACGINNVTRLWGQNAAGTSSKIAQWCIDRGMSASNVGVATSKSFYDALTGGALCGKNNAPLVLVSNENRSTVYSFLNPHRASIGKGYIFGGHLAVSTASASLVQSGAGKTAYSNMEGHDVSGFLKLGIDVSHWQGYIDWQQVKNSGVDFAIVRVAHGVGPGGVIDEQHRRNFREAKAAGVTLGAYLYSDTDSAEGARNEANQVINLLRDAGMTAADLALGVYYDLEEPRFQNEQSRDLLLDMTKTFAGTLKDGGFEKVGVYSNLNWWTNFLPSSEYNRFTRWIAQWNSECTYFGPYRIWQFSSKGRVPGIDGDVDMDLLYY
ncbi:MAG: cell wall-binding repeat-containing protein [Eggerthellaceae bacterium]|nr:cell wall-binding repeat-containing protein [Eggerthellaceae bacterium]